MPMGEPPPGLRVRELNSSDSLGELTQLLHRAYAPLAQRGLRYVATHQDEETTRRRITGGNCLVAILHDRLVGTVTFKRRQAPGLCDWYERMDVAYCEQLGVEPHLQGRGVGNLLMDLVEERAWRTGATEIALDTSEHAHDLIGWYLRREYRVVEQVNWDVTNYLSVVLSKKLSLPPVAIREAGDDVALLMSMLAESVNWDPGRSRISRPELLARCEFRRYVERWGRRGDYGVLAEDEAGTALGAAWFRAFPADRGGFGFVAEDIPEISIAVRRPWRGHGLGNKLLSDLEKRARRSGIQALSLSVEEANSALRLYRRRGYRTVSRIGGSRTMILRVAVDASEAVDAAGIARPRPHADEH